VFTYWSRPNGMSGPSGMKAGMYRERPPEPGLGLACVWTRTTAAAHAQLVVPDGCIDVIWSADGVQVAGPDTRPRVASLAAGALARGESVGATAARLGLSDRQLRRRCLVAFGYGPKTLQRVLRFQRALRLARQGVPFAEVACAAGYADQAHLAHDVRDLAGVTLSDLL
jgi:AraC-like DNA-binding protein